MGSAQRRIQLDEGVFSSLHEILSSFLLHTPALSSEKVPFSEKNERENTTICSTQPLAAMKYWTEINNEMKFIAVKM